MNPFYLAKCARASIFTMVMFGAIWIKSNAAEFPASVPDLPAVKDLPTQSAMPDPLALVDGHKISTPEQWQENRQKIQNLIEYYALGRMPPSPGNVTGRILASQSVLDGKAKFQMVRLTFGPEDKLSFVVAIFIPTGTSELKSPFPTIVQPSFSPTPGTWSLTNNSPGTNIVKKIPPQTPEAAAEQYAEPLRRGYAVVTFNYQECGADNKEYRQSGFFAAYPGYDWGDLAAWAWGMSRCVDYLEQQPFVDKAKIIAVGHSRLGKATLVAGAFDERFALVAPAGSGCGGTGAYRYNGKDRGGKEGLEDATKHFPQWFGPRLVEFSGQVEKLPFDQHWLIALVAPRCFIAPDGLDDGAANENALAHAWLAAKPVYELLGVPDHLGIHFRPGKHMLAPADWQAILDFSDQQLRGLKVAERFDQLPPLEQLH